MNLLEEVEKLKAHGYNETNAQSRICQDIILLGISKANFDKNVTIKGGVVMRNLSKDVRRSTQDMDLDFIKYSISDDSIEKFLNDLCVNDGLCILIKKPIIELNHKDYKGKRVFVEIKDEFGHSLETKLDIGVHKDLDIAQEEYSFDLCFQDDTIRLLMNSREQIITEKLKSFLRFGTRSTRYKDVFDIYYLSAYVNKMNMRKCIERYIFSDSTLPVNNMNDVIKRIERVFKNDMFMINLNKSRKNWMDIDVEEVVERNLEFIKTLL